MRHSFVVSTSLVLAACGGAPAEAPAPATPAPSPALTPAEAQQKTLADYAAAWVAGDAEKAASYFTEEGVVKMAGAPDATGRSAIAATIAGTLAGSKDGKLPFTRTFAKGDVIVGEWGWAGTHTGNLMGIEATNKPFGLMGVSIYFFTSDAKLKEAHAYFDAGTLMSQLGLSKEKARPVQALPTEPLAAATATGSAEEQRNADAVTKLMGAFEKKSEADFLATMSDAITWDDMTRPETMKGKPAAKQYFKTMLKAFPDASIAVQNVWPVGDVVIVETTFSGTQMGALGPIKATKKPVSLHGVDIIQFDAEGKIARGWSYGNSGEMAMQLGLVPPPAPPGKAGAAPAPKG